MDHEEQIIELNKTCYDLQLQLEAERSRYRKLLESRNGLGSEVIGDLIRLSDELDEIIERSRALSSTRAESQLTDLRARYAALDRARQDGRMDEREASVKWMREYSLDCNKTANEVREGGGWAIAASTAEHCANSINRGAHLPASPVDGAGDGEEGGE